MSKSQIYQLKQMAEDLYRRERGEGASHALALSVVIDAILAAKPQTSSISRPGRTRR